MWDEITYPFPNFNLEMDKLFHCLLYNECNYLSMLGLKLKCWKGSQCTWYKLSVIVLEIRWSKCTLQSQIYFQNRFRIYSFETRNAWLQDALQIGYIRLWIFWNEKNVKYTCFYQEILGGMMHSDLDILPISLISRVKQNNSDQPY